MKKRILSLVLAFVMCFSVVSVFAANNEAVLMGEIGDLVNNYRDRAWTWQENQFEAMTDDQKDAIEGAWTSYEAQKDAIKAIAEELAGEFATEEYVTLGLADTKDGKDGTLKNLYKWKLMRDIMEGNLDVTCDDAGYTEWLAAFTEFEEANDEAISPSQPTAALGNLGGYSKTLTKHFGNLAVLVNNGLALEGEGATKVQLYVDAFKAEEEGTAYPDGFTEELKEDIIALAADGMFNVFDLGMQLATGKITKENTDGVFEMIPDRDMKAAFLILGEDFVNYLLDLIPTMKSKLLSMNKDELVPVVMPYATDLLGENNGATVDAMYNVTEAVAKYIAGKDFNQDAVTKVDEYYGADVMAGITAVKEALFEAMDLIDTNHGIELIHYNTFMGRELLRYDNEGDWTKLSGAEIDGDTVTGLVLGFAHDRYPVVENNLNLTPNNVASFDANYDADGIKVYAGEGVGELVIEVTEEADGTATVNVYRGYSDTDFDGVLDVEEDVYRYVTSFTVTATSDVVPETPYVTLDDVLDTTVDGTIEVKGTTNLDYVTVAIIKNGETIYAVVYSKAEFEAGITLNAPDAAAEGDVYTVVVGTEKASASDEFAIEGAAVEYEVVLDDVADTTADGTIEVKGTTNLDYVTVAIVKNGETIYAVVYSKAEFEAGITLNAPDAAAEGDVYTVVVGTEKASDSDEFAIVDETIVYEITLEDIADFKLSDNENAEIVVKGTTNLPYVVVTVTLGDDGVYAVTHTKAEYEAGITIQIDGAVAGNVYTVAVGQDGTEAEDTFEILPEAPVAPSGSLAISGGTTRKVKVGKTTEITATPQNIQPDGATVEVVWTTEDGEIIEVTEVVTAENGASIATITKLAKGTATLTATLYVNGEAVDSKVITVKNPSTGGDDGITVKPDEPIVKPHTCEWPDIAATETKAAHWAHETIDIMTINGYIKGYEDGTFKPDNNITRAEFSAIVYRILGLEIAEDGVLYDDTTGHWAEDIIATMSLPEGYGMLRGYGDGNFGPNDLITREQAVAIIARAKSAVWVAAEEGAKDVFTDAEDISWWFDGEMDAAVTNGLITGYEDGSYKPLNYTTRAEACVLLARAWPEVLELD